MFEITKSQKKHLRELSGVAYERAISIALNSLYEKFKAWENKEITPWELNQEIHQHHNGVSKELYKTYMMSSDPWFEVAQALAKGVLKIEEVREDCRELFERFVANIQDKKSV